MTGRPSPLALPPEPQPPLGLLARIQKALSPRTSPANVPDVYTNTGMISMGSMGMVNSNTALMRVPGAPTWRAYAATPWVFAAINKRVREVASAEWDIVPYDNTQRSAARQADKLRRLFDQPSAKLDSFQSFATTVIAELLTLDASPIEKVRYPGDGQIAELWPTRGDWIAVDERWDGSDPDRARYYFVPDGTVRAKFTNEDMLYLVANQRNNSALGISPMLVLQVVIESELQSMEYNRRQVMGAAPDGVLNIGETASPDDVQRTQSRFQSEVFGQGAMAVIGGFKAPSWMPFRSSNRDMQFREWQDYLVRCIAVALGIAPMDLAITFDVNRSTAEVQQDSTDDGLRALMSLFQGYMTREVVWDRAYGGRANNLQFAFKSLNLDESLSKANINKIAMPGIGWKSINEARTMDGRAPIGEPNSEGNLFNHILVGSPKGIIDLNTGKYVGEEQLAELQSQSKIDVAKAVAEAAPVPKPPAE